jgi:uncharacterized membrane protein
MFKHTRKGENTYLAAITSIFLTIIACHYDPIVPATPIPTLPTTSSCSPDTAYFQNDVLPILVSNCAKSGCHDATSKKDGIQTTDYATVMKEVKPYTLSDGDLYKYITHKDPKKIMPPPPAQPLTVAQKDIIAQWILQGAKNNACNESSGSCNTQNIKYSTFVKPLMEKFCTGCHATTNPQANIALATHAEVQKYAKAGSLYGSVAHSGNYSKMPKGGTKLNDCDIAKLKAWIDAGALND